MQTEIERRGRTTRRKVVASLTAVVTAGALTATGVALAVVGNIHPAAIEIDASANLYPGDVTRTCANATFGGAVTDWVKDCLPNTDTPSLTDSVATGVNLTATATLPQTGAARTGHWNGVRIVDGIAGDDKDIFLTGGKEQDLSTWNVGPGTVGSSKYDATQAYLANNNTDVFFGMERRGNNGTTAFDFEFNVNPQAVAGSYLPTRTTGDVMLTFEMQGSGGSGSAVPHYYTYNGTTYVEQLPPPAGIVTTINQTAVPAAPWGYVNSRGDWAIGSLDRFEFAEAKVPLRLLNGGHEFDPCVDASRYVQVRTRSSSTDNSDLKDTTKIFKFDFFAPEPPSTTLQGTCEQSFTFSTAAAAPSWKFTVPAAQYQAGAGVTLSGKGTTVLGGPTTNGAGDGIYTSSNQSGEVNVSLPAGVASATVSVEQTTTAGGGGCAASDNKTITVYRQLGATATLTPQCDNTFTYAGTASGGKGTISYSWEFFKADGTKVGSSLTTSGSFTAPSQGAYYAELTVSDEADTASGKAICTKKVTSNSVNVYNPVGGTISLTGDCDNTFTYSAQGSGGKAPYSYAIKIQKNVGGTWTDAKSISATDTVAIPGVGGTVDVNDVSVNPGGPGSYRAVVTITDSQGIVCTANATSNVIDVVNPLTASATKTSATETTATLTGSSASGVTLQWQRKNGSDSDWVNITDATTTTLAFSAFATQATRSAKTFVVDGDNYVGALYSIDIRLHASRTVNGQLCDAFSSAVPVKKLIGVDP